MTPPTFTRSGVRVPSRATLRRYGITLAEWTAILDRQGGVCAVCRSVPRSGILHIDHEHVRRWKKLEPHVRALSVRGLLCWRCNTSYVGRSITVERARRVVAYLERYRLEPVVRSLVLQPAKGAATP